MVCPHPVEDGRHPYVLVTAVHTTHTQHVSQDSVFVTWTPDTTMDQAFGWGREYAAAVTKHFLPPISLCFEKVLHPLLLFKKKR